MDYDLDFGQLYVAGESGVLSIFHAAATGVTKIGEGLVGPNAHSLAINPATREICFRLKDIDRHPMMRVMRLGA
ncbi:hypothetical protein JYK21_26585 [Ralstonia pickettii]|nr:hypothetical protein [Ralstonia pickettii]